MAVKLLSIGLNYRTQQQYIAARNVETATYRRREAVQLSRYNGTEIEQQRGLQSVQMLVIIAPHRPAIGRKTG